MPRRLTVEYHEHEPGAVLEQDGIIVAMGNAAASNSKHRALRAYECESFNGGEISCIVPIALGDRYCIHASFEGESLPFPEAGLCFEVRLDGHTVIWSFIRSREILSRISQIKRGLPVATGEIEVNGQHLPGDQIRPFQFRLRPTTETGDEVLPINLECFGQVLVGAHWTIEHPKVQEDSSYDKDKADNIMKSLHEPVDEKLKRVQHRCLATMGDPELDPDSDRYITDGLGTILNVPDDEKYWFCFKYVEREVLIADGKIPPQTTETGYSGSSKRRKVDTKKKLVVKERSQRRSNSVKK